MPCRRLDASWMHYTLRFLVVVWMTSALSAQTAALRGQVTDQSGAVIPGAGITLTGPAGLVKSTTSDEHGSYRLVGLALGDYVVVATAPQLALRQPVPIALKPGLRTLNLQLAVASLAEKVTVQENAGPIGQYRRRQ